MPSRAGRRCLFMRSSSRAETASPPQISRAILGRSQRTAARASARPRNGRWRRTRAHPRAVPVLAQPEPPRRAGKGREEGQRAVPRTRPRVSESRLGESARATKSGVPSKDWGRFALSVNRNEGPDWPQKAPGRPRAREAKQPWKVRHRKPWIVRIGRPKWLTKLLTALGLSLPKTGERAVQRAQSVVKERGRLALRGRGTSAPSSAPRARIPWDSAA